MNRVATLVETEDLAISRFDHPPECVHEDPPEERADVYSISFVQQGSFELCIDGARTRLGPGAAFLTHPGLVFQCRHGEACPLDVCVSVRYSPELMEGARRFLGDTFASVVRPFDLQTGFWQSRLERSLAGDALTAEAVSLDLVLLLKGSARRRRAICASRPAGWYRASIERVRDRLHAEFDRPITIAELAREAGLSSFHFIRLFRDLVGLRLLWAAGRLEQGMPVTTAAFASGFENLSHFTRSFRRWFGMAPSAWSAAAAPDRSRRKVQALLRATR
jgi:AraC-like DNA-binding protein